MEFSTVLMTMVFVLPTKLIKKLLENVNVFGEDTLKPLTTMDLVSILLILMDKENVELKMFLTKEIKEITLNVVINTDAVENTVGMMKNTTVNVMMVMLDTTKDINVFYLVKKMIDFNSFFDLFIRLFL